jgi:hypothetical protein
VKRFARAAVFFLIAIATGSAARAQSVQIPCPAGSSPIADLITRNQPTGALLDNACVDVNGNIIIPLGSGLGGAGAALAGNANAVYLSNACPQPFQGNCYFVNADTKACFTGSTTNNQPTITVSLTNGCGFTAADVGKNIFVTNGCTASGCGALFSYNTVNITPYTTITAFNSSSSITIGANATASCAAICIVIYGHDDTANLATVNAFIQTGMTCPVVQLPTGFMLLAQGGMFNTVSKNCSMFSVSNPTNQMAATNASLVVMGQGPASGFVLTPTFAANMAASCTGNGNGGLSTGANTACFGAVTGSIFENFGIFGFGQSLSGGNHAQTLFYLVQGSYADKLWINNYGENDSSLVGVQIGYSYVTNSAFMGSGAISVVMNGAYGYLSNSIAGFSGTNAIIFQTSSNPFVTMGNEFWGGNGTTPTVIDGGLWFSTGDSVVPPSGAGASMIFLNSALAEAHISQMTEVGGVASQFGLNLANASAKAFLRDSKMCFGGACTNWFTSTGGTLIDLGGNSVVGGITGTGVFRRQAGGMCCTALTAGNFAFGGNWGTSPAFTTITGFDAGFKLTVTSGTGAPGANPTITLTFADGIWPGSGPTCVANRGETNAPFTATWTTGSANASLVLTFVGTPAVSTQYIAQVTCLPIS